MQAPCHLFTSEQEWLEYWLTVALGFMEAASECPGLLVFRAIWPDGSRDNWLWVPGSAPLQFQSRDAAGAAIVAVEKNFPGLQVQRVDWPAESFYGVFFDQLGKL